MAERDPLTQVFNRRKFFDVAQTGIVAAQAGGSAASLILLDLDHFKAINDRHGHQAGDDVLRTVADHLRRALAPGTAV
ncbi:GGDEF domain-containing protein, partial [Acinetobacter baumannii]